jgi:hypothetical protein
MIFMNRRHLNRLCVYTYIGAMTTHPRFMLLRSIGPRSMGPIGSWVPYTMILFVRIGSTYILCFFEGTNRACLNLHEFAPICIKFLPNIAPRTLYTLKRKIYISFRNDQAIKNSIHLSHFDVKIVFLINFFQGVLNFTDALALLRRMDHSTLHD